LLLLEYDQHDHSHDFFWMCDVIFNLSAGFFVVPEKTTIRATCFYQKGCNGIALPYIEDPYASQGEPGGGGGGGG